MESTLFQFSKIKKYGYEDLYGTRCFSLTYKQTISDQDEIS